CADQAAQADDAHLLRRVVGGDLAEAAENVADLDHLRRAALGHRIARRERPACVIHFEDAHLHDERVDHGFDLVRVRDPAFLRRHLARVAGGQAAGDPEDDDARGERADEPGAGTRHAALLPNWRSIASKSTVSSTMGLVTYSSNPARR